MFKIRALHNFAKLLFNEKVKGKIMKICPYCNAQSDDLNIYCSLCGKDLSGARQVDYTQYNEGFSEYRNEPTQYKPVKKSHKNRLVIASVALVSAISVAMTATAFVETRNKMDSYRNEYDIRYQDGIGIDEFDEFTVEKDCIYSTAYGDNHKILILNMKENKDMSIYATVKDPKGNVIGSSYDYVRASLNDPVIVDFTEYGISSSYPDDQWIWEYNIDFYDRTEKSNSELYEIESYELISESYSDYVTVKIKQTEESENVFATVYAVFYKDGEIVSIYYDVSSDLAGKGTEDTLKIYIYDNIEYDSMELIKN